MNIKWKWYNFEEINNFQLHALFQLRQNIFIVEQNVPYYDIDEKDIVAKHLLGEIDGNLVGALRLLPVNVFEEGYISFGRVVVPHNIRGQGIGHSIMRELLNYIKNNSINHPIKISSQYYLKKFYMQYGFKSIGKPYIEDKIKHIAMVNNKKRNYVY